MLGKTQTEELEINFQKKKKRKKKDRPERPRLYLNFANEFLYVFLTDVCTPHSRNLSI